MRNDGTDLTPHIVSQDEQHELWYKRDRSFFVAKSDMFVKFIFPHDVNQPEYATMLRLLVYALNHHMRNFFYAESLRQNKFHINASANGFSTKIFTFSETIGSTTVNFFKNMRALKLSEQEFELVKDEMKSQIKSQLNLVPMLRGYVNFFTLILRDYIHFNKLLVKLEQLRLADFTNFFNELFESLYIKAFVHGSLSKERATKIFVDKILPIFKLKEKPVPVSDTFKNYLNPHADLSGYHIFREQMTKNYNVIHAVLNFYQIGEENIANIINANLVKALCGYIYFTQLRIKEQLGYTARGRVFAEGNVIYYMILVQGSKKTPDVMDERIENLLGLMRKRIEETNETRFNRLKKYVARFVGRWDKQLKTRTIRLWNEIITGRKYFNIAQVANDYVKTLSKEAVLKFFDQMISGKLQKLSVQEFSKQAQLPSSIHEVRGFTPNLLKDQDGLRNKNKFLKFK